MATTEKVKELREKTGVSIMQCKNALEEAGDDMDKAIVILNKKSGAAATKKSDRALGAGVVQSYVHNNNEVGATVVLGCETDFVAKNEEFIKMAYDMAMHVAAANPEFLSRDEVDEKATKAARGVFTEEVKDKPKNLQEGIINGKLDSYFKDKILIEQPFIKNQDKTIGGLLDEAVQKFGERVQIISFSRHTIRG